MADPYWSSVVLLACNENGADGSTTFVDTSNSAKTLTAVGDAKFATAQAPTGMTSSAVFDGTGDRITTPNHADFGFGTGDFTVEAYIYGNAFPFNHFHAPLGTYNALNGWQFTMDINGQKMQFGAGDGSTATDFLVGATTLSTATWYHIAATRSGTSAKLWLNGSEDAAATNSYDIAAVNQLCIGQSAELIAARDWDGYIASVRITKGVARYTANFTPPALALPVGGIVPILLNQYRQRRN